MKNEKWKKAVENADLNAISMPKTIEESEKLLATKYADKKRDPVFKRLYADKLKKPVY